MSLCHCTLTSLLQFSPAIIPVVLCLPVAYLRRQELTIRVRESCFPSIRFLNMNIFVLGTFGS